MRLGSTTANLMLKHHHYLRTHDLASSVPDHGHHGSEETSRQDMNNCIRNCNAFMNTKTAWPSIYSGPKSSHGIGDATTGVAAETLTLRLRDYMGEAGSYLVVLAAT